MGICNYVLGHFVFERNIPTILKNPSTPFVVALDVIKAFVVRCGTIGNDSARSVELEVSAYSVTPVNPTRVYPRKPFGPAAKQR